MFPLKRACIALAGIALAACGDDRSVNPVAEFVDGNGAAITSGGTLVAQYSLLVGQTLKINPKTTTRTNRLRWSSSNSTVASVNSTGTVTARTSGTATVQVSGTGVLENYAVTVTAPAAPKVNSFSLQPKTGVSLTSGQSQQFSASATWSDGMQYPITVSYTATGGTISGTGLFTAGNLAGTFMVVATCACTSPAIADTAFVNITAPQLTKLTVSPKTVSLAAGASQQFGVTASWNTGATTVPPVTWTASAGTVSSTGAYVAPSAAGTYQVIVAHTNGTVRDTAVVTVSAPAQLTSLTVSPKTLSLTAGASQQFAVAAAWSTGATTVPPVTWSATGGTVSSTGAYVAPSTAGTYRVIVAHTNGTVRDTAVVTVGASAGTGGGTTTSAGAPWSILRDFNSGAVGTVAQRTPDGFDDVAGNSVYSRDYSVDGSQAVRLSIDSGSTGWGRWGGIVKFPRNLSSGEELWLDVSVFLPTDFNLAAAKTSSKFIRVATRDTLGQNQGYNDLFFSTGSRSNFAMQAIKEGQFVWFPMGTSSDIAVGRWHRYSVHLRFDAVSKALGGRSQLRVWLDGRLLLDEPRIQSLKNATDVAHSFFLFTYWADGAPGRQTVWADNIRLSSFRPAWASTLQGADNY